MKITEVGRVLLFLCSFLVCLTTQRYKELLQHNGGSINQPLHQSAATENDVCKNAALFPQHAAPAGWKVGKSKAEFLLSSLLSLSCKGRGEQKGAGHGG